MLGRTIAGRAGATVFWPTRRPGTYAFHDVRGEKLRCAAKRQVAPDITHLGWDGKGLGADEGQPLFVGKRHLPRGPSLASQEAREKDLGKIQEIQQPAKLVFPVMVQKRSKTMRNDPKTISKNGRKFFYILIFQKRKVIRAAIDLDVDVQITVLMSMDRTWSWLRNM